MGTRIIHNKRTHDTNIQKNRVVVPTGQEFTLPSDVVRSVEDRDAIVAALQVFCAVTDRGLKLPGRDHAADEALLGAAQRVLQRF